MAAHGKDSLCYTGSLGTSYFLGMSHGGLYLATSLYFLCFMIIVLLFAVLRKKIWDYGRVALVSDPVSARKVSSNPLNQSSSGSNLIPLGGLYPCNPHTKHGHTSSAATARHLDTDTGLFTWVRTTLLMSDSEIQEHCGEDAVHYLSFQRHIIVMLVFVAILSVGIILPIHLNGHFIDEDIGSYFVKTTIANVQNRNLLWTHIVFALIYIVLAVVLMYHYRGTIKYSDENMVKQTLFITGIPRKLKKETISNYFRRQHLADIMRSRSKTGLRLFSRYFTGTAYKVCLVCKHTLQTFPLKYLFFDITHTALLKSHRLVLDWDLVIMTYPSCHVSDVHLCYDDSDLMDLYSEREKAEKKLEYYQNLFHSTGKRRVISTSPCGLLCSWTRGSCKQADAIDYYRQLRDNLLQKIEDRRQVTPSSSLGIAFVTFTSESMATSVLEDLKLGKAKIHPCEGVTVTQPLEDVPQLRTAKWTVKYATYTDNIYWKNLSIQGVRWWARFFTINICLLILLFFLTTPSIWLSVLDQLNITEFVHHIPNSTVMKFLSIILLWTFTALLPTVVYYSSWYERHWTKSEENINMMSKIYIFLILMVLILPSLDLTSIDYFFRWLFNKSLDTVRLECIFIPEQGAFFTIYVIVATFVGNGMELARLPGLIRYICRMMKARSEADRIVLKQNQAYDFPYGSMYARLLLVVSIIMAYSLIYPMITPFGLIYIFIKQFVDRHNLIFAYLPTKLDREIHVTAIKQAIAAPVLCLLWLFLFLVLHMGIKAPTTLLSLTCLLLVIIIWSEYSCGRYFRNLDLFKTKEEKDHSPAG